MDSKTKPEFEIELNPRFVRDDTAVGMIGGTVVMIGSSDGGEWCADEHAGIHDAALEEDD